MLASLAKRYTVEHEALAFDDATGLGTVSITNHAQSSLGDVVFVELLAKVGTTIAQGGMFATAIFYFQKSDKSGLDQIGAVESVKAASDIVRCA